VGARRLLRTPARARAGRGCRGSAHHFTATPCTSVAESPSAFMTASHMRCSSSGPSWYVSCGGERKKRDEDGRARGSRQARRERGSRQAMREASTWQLVGWYAYLLQLGVQV
jgi:hypothetical protein